MRHKAPLASLLLLASFANAGNTYDGYENYYSTLSGTIFKSADKHELEAFSTPPNENIKYSWSGKIEGQQRHVSISNGLISIDGKYLKTAKARAFPNETTSREDLGRNTDVYLSKDYTCFESVSPSASGTAIRHTSVYLINHKEKPVVFLKLPSLFASCTGIRITPQELITFNKIEYQYEKGEDYPSGVKFTEYTTNKRQFYKSKKEAIGKFIEPDNVYKFTIESE
ncbi:hypothetical protein [Janthinobacterium sp. B9-8]|uniref:hypothetical protein n=1 Tax=Janthinobacterium sp. B9-8 TaxID=1236179 RepID=UPI00061D3634|nr:hypothetical protein [Janthinobacterium sp. B9-8]AMC35238.1 hypothetical protein VN23_11755 [Janthinobacterium sp. B9-8]